MFIAVFTTGHQSSPLQAELTHFLHAHPITFRQSLILASHLYLVYTSGLFYSGFPVEILYAFVIASLIRAMCPANFALHNYISLPVLVSTTNYEASFSVCF